MTKVEVSPAIYQWMTSCAIILTLTFLLLILFYHSQTTCRKLKQFGNKTLILSFALIISGLFVAIGTFALHFLFTEPTISDGRILVGFLTSAYILFKLVLYSFLSVRLYDAFKESLFRCRKIDLLCWESFLIISSIANIIALNLTSKIVIDYDLKPTVRAEYNTLALTSVALTDLIACTVNFYLFGRKLYQILYLGVDTKKHGTGFEYIAQKTCCLTYFAIISTLVTLFFIALVAMSIVWTSLDIIISIFSVILMFSWNDKYFQCICGWCVNSIQNKATQAVTLSINTTNSNMPEVQISHTSNTMTIDSPKAASPDTQVDKIENKTEHKHM